MRGTSHLVSDREVTSSTVMSKENYVWDKGTTGDEVCYNGSKTKVPVVRVEISPFNNVK